MIAFIAAAGWPIYFLLLASIVALWLISDRMLFLYGKYIAPSGLLDQTMQTFRQEGASDALLARLDSGAPLGRVFADGLKNADSTPEERKEAIEESGRTVAHQLERFITTV